MEFNEVLSKATSVVVIMQKHSCLVCSRNIYWSLEFSLAWQAEPECRICNVFCWTGVIASI